MKRLAAMATILAGLAMPVAAQRAVSRGGFSGHAVSAPHSFAPRGGGFATHVPTGMRPSPPPRGFTPRGPMGVRPTAPRGFSYPTAPTRFRPTYGSGTRTPLNHLGADHRRDPRDWRGPGPGDSDDHHHHHRGVYWGGSVYPYYPWFYTGPIFTGYVDPWLFGPDDYYGDSYGADVPAPYRDYGMQSSQPYPAEYYQGNPALPQQDPESQQAYAPQGPAAMPSSSLAAASGQGAVTLIFNDGRPPVQIHNYLLTASTLTVLDPQYREIPLDKINVAATEQTNRAAGVDFRVPVKQ